MFACPGTQRMVNFSDITPRQLPVRTCQQFNRVCPDLVPRNGCSNNSCLAVYTHVLIAFLLALQYFVDGVFRLASQVEG